MEAKTLEKLEATYEALTAHIVALGPKTADKLALPMLDLENVLNEAMGYPAKPLKAPPRPSKTH